MSDDQLDFEFYSKLAPRIDLPGDRAEPVLWFSKVVLLRQLDASKESLVREITLRRGLNIVWAPPEEPEDQVQLYGEGLSGHASGKTLFCRILRYLLGEETFGTEILQKAVDQKFLGDLWALAEIYIGGTLWLVGKPLAGRDKHRAFAMADWTVDRFLAEQPPHDRYANFTDAVHETICGPWWHFESIRPYAGMKQLLPWLARDQECRFASLTEWRKSTLSNSPLHSPSVLAQQELMRAVLSLLNENEQKARHELSSEETKLEAANSIRPMQETDWKREWGRLKRSLAAAEIEISDEEPDDAIKLSELLSRVELTMTGLDEATRLCAEDEVLKSAETAREFARKVVAELRGRIAASNKALSDTEEKWKEVCVKIQSNQENQMQDVSRIAHKLCPYSLDHARKRKCFVDSDEPLENATHIGDLDLQSDGFSELIAKQKAELARLVSQLDQTEAECLESEKVYSRERNRVQQRVYGYDQRRQRLLTALQRFPDAKDVLRTLIDTRTAVRLATARKAELKGEIEGYKKFNGDFEDKLSEFFSDAVRAVMGGKMDAQLELTEKGIRLIARRNGELSGAALETIKVLSFDIAAIVFSMTGRGYHPRFLIHDGPREADMARVIYERFFLYIRRLEDLFAETNEPSFQYIVTTTTPPPKAMRQGSKWLKLELNTTIEEERLLRMNL